MNNVVKWIIISVLAILAIAAIVFVGVYFSRFQTMFTIGKITNYSDYNLYRMDVKYDYDIDDVIDYGIEDTQSFSDAIVKEAFPLLPIKMEVPDFGCSAFSIKDTDNDVLMGRNYDFSRNTSSMLVYCTPKNGYKSVAFAALDNISANDADGSLKTKFACLTAPFVCLDGMNEKGVSIAVLTLDSEPTRQDTDKQGIATSLAIRLVLDKAATTQEAVDLLKQYDMIASSGRDYHFYINDASGDGRVIEYDCESETRELVATPVRTVTNFFEIYKDKVLPNQKNGIYGHGKDRYDKIEAVFDKNNGTFTKNTAWEALEEASQLPKDGDVTSNTQWSIVYDNTALTADVVIRRDWNTKTSYDLNTNTVK